MTEENETLRKRNSMIKLEYKHVCDPVQEYLNSLLTDSNMNKDNAVNVHCVNSRANSRRRNSKPYNLPVKKLTNGYGRLDNNGTKFNINYFFRG